MRQKMPNDYGYRVGDKVVCLRYGCRFTFQGKRQYRCPHCGGTFSPDLWKKAEV